MFTELKFIQTLTFFYSVTFAASLLIGNPIKSCPHEWVQWRDSCFMFSVEKEDWYRAELRCRALGGHLAEIFDDQTNTLLKNHVKALHYGDHQAYYFIGLTDVAKTDTWEWPYSQTLPAYTDWGAGQPNHAANDEHCVFLNGEDSFNWHDVDCDRAERFICQKNSI